MTGFIFRSTTVVMKFLEKIFDSNLKVTGVENIPDAPILFVANHFTRAETFILPYMMHRAIGRNVRSLADKKIFVGALGKYLTSMGTLATSDPNRNKIIMGDLLTGNSDWLIYPEGIMVKNKHVSKGTNYTIQMPDGQHRRVKTGSAVLAIKTELIKKKLFRLGEEKNIKESNKLKERYLLKEEDNISPKNLHIVPITINYFPIRPGNNSIHSISKRFIKNLSGRILEELEIEGNIITNSEVTINFGTPINVYEYTKSKRKLVYKIPFIAEEGKNNLLLNYYRHRLTTSFMDTIYGNVELNMDHIFACSLFYYHHSKISRHALKNLIYSNARDIKKLNKFKLHPSIDRDISMVFMAEENIYYDSIFKLAIEQGIISKEHDEYFINRKKLLDFTDFHQGRLHNTLKIFVNQLVKFPELTKVFKSNCKSSDVVLREKTFQLICRSDEKEHFDDYEKYFSRSESKSREFGKPFFLENKKSKIGIILSHGYKAAPEEVRVLANYLHGAGFNVYAVRLKGHGTAPDNMKHIEWEDWYKSYFKGYAALKHRCDHIVSAGFSTGGLLALLLAARKGKNIDAVISINAAIKLNDIRVNLVPTVHFWNELLTKFNATKGKKEFIIDTPENPKINYSKNYLKGVKELSDLMGECNKSLKDITAPTLIIQADKDPVVDPKSAEIIYKKIASKKKELITPSFDNHVIIKKEDKELFNNIVEFINNNVGVS